ncbi:MAG: hypothetical protein WC752_04225 [Patescibacteria group bacterium]|jgi:hypothetical protein
MVDFSTNFNAPNIPSEVHTMPDKFASAGGNAPPPTGLQTPPKKGSKASWIIIAVIIVAVIAIVGGGIYLITSNLPSKQTQEAINEGKTNATNSIVANANGNLNANKNGNLNGNSNANKNSNKNGNSNDNENSNSNANRNENTNTSSTNTSIKIAPDSDNDGLTAAEEKLYGTKVDKPDTDEDGFKDGVEVINGYDPTADGNIQDGSYGGLYTNEDFNYRILYPKGWNVEPIAEDNKNVIFTPQEEENAGEFIEMITETNPYGFSAMDWYLDQNKDASENLIDEITVNGEDGVMSVDGYTVYFTDENYVYAIHYNFGSKKEVNFSSTFRMMYQSIKLHVKKTTSDQTNSNSNTSIISNTNTNKNSNSNLNSNKNSNSNTND